MAMVRFVCLPPGSTHPWGHLPDPRAEHELVDYGQRGSESAGEENIMPAPTVGRRCREEGCDTGLTAVNRFSGERIRWQLIRWATDGAIMAVPAHDERDFEFCTGYGINVRPVIRPSMAFWLIQR